MEQTLHRSKSTDIKNLDLKGIQSFLEDIGEDPARAIRIYKHLWKKSAQTFDEMHTIPKQTRKLLSQHAHISFLQLLQRNTCTDGTQKYLWKLPNGGAVESVLIPDENRKGGFSDRLTLCVSSQWGCAMKCTFCLTGDLGLKGQLSASQIANQPLQVSQFLPPGKRITNIVMMGMGEPLHNYKNLVIALRNMLNDDAMNLSHRKITVSTVGLLPAMKRLANELPVNLAISLNATTEEQRRKVMPITNKYSLHELLETCRQLPLPPGKRIAFEYVMMKDFNDTLKDAERLFNLLQGIPSKVNLIPYNENPDRNIKRPTEQQVKTFQTYLVNKGLHTTVRTTRGLEISAACGQLGKAFEAVSTSQKEQNYV